RPGPTAAVRPTAGGRRMTTHRTRPRPAAWAAALAALALAVVAGAGGPPPRAPARSDPAPVRADRRFEPAPNPDRAGQEKAADRGRVPIPMPSRPGANPVPAPAPWGAAVLMPDAQQLGRGVQTVAVFALVSLAPAAVLMVTAFVRINVVLVMLRQALGSPQVPGNQVVLALSLLLTALVMEPIGVQVYRRGIEPYASGREPSAARAGEAGVAPVKQFMIDQICRTHHEQYLWDLYDAAGLNRPGEPEPTECEQFPLRVVAPAFLLGELTTALFIGFAIYLPFLVIDLVV